MKALFFLIFFFVLTGCMEAPCDFQDEELDGACVTLRQCNNKECTRQNIDDFVSGRFDGTCAAVEARYDFNGVCYISSHNCKKHQACDYIADVQTYGRAEAKKRSRFCDVESHAGNLMCESCEIAEISCVKY